MSATITEQTGQSIMTLEYVTPDTVVNAIADYTGTIDSYPVIINDAEAA